VNIFKPESNKVIQEKFYFLMDSLSDRDIFTKES
ncbi:cysteine desulfurase, partial [Streptococcus suis]